MIYILNTLFIIYILSFFQNNHFFLVEKAAFPLSNLTNPCPVWS